jgi:uncharacterized protein (UPF0335 family)
MVNGVFDGPMLKLLVERAERVEEEIAGLKDDLKDIFSDAKANGFNPKVMKKCMALRKQDKEQRDEEETLLEAYKRVLGLSDFDETPLGQSVAKLDELADESGGTISIQTADGTTVAEFGSEAKKKRGKGPVSNSMSTIPGGAYAGEEPAEPEKPKRGRPKKVREPDGGELVTVPANGVDSTQDSAAS